MKVLGPCFTEGPYDDLLPGGVLAEYGSQFLRQAAESLRQDLERLADLTGLLPEAKPASSQKYLLHQRGQTVT